MKHKEPLGISFDQICPECGVGNPSDTKNCLVCDKNLENTLAFLEDDSFDLEITKDYLYEYRKNFWGNRRTGKVNQYRWDGMNNIIFGSPVNRLIFIYNDKRVVIPLREENMEILKDLLETLDLIKF